MRVDELQVTGRLRSSAQGSWKTDSTHPWKLLIRRATYPTCWALPLPESRGADQQMESSISRVLFFPSNRISTPPPPAGGAKCAQSHLEKQQLFSYSDKRTVRLLKVPVSSVYLYTISINPHLLGGGAWGWTKCIKKSKDLKPRTSRTASLSERSQNSKY